MIIYVGNMTFEENSPQLNELLSGDGDKKSLLMRVRSKDGDEKLYGFVGIDDEVAVRKTVDSLGGEQFENQRVIAEFIEDAGLSASSVDEEGAAEPDAAEEVGDSPEVVELKEHHKNEKSELQALIDKLEENLGKMEKEVGKALASRDQLKDQFEEEHNKCIELKKAVEVIRHGEAKAKKALSRKLGESSGTESQLENIILENKTLKQKLALTQQKVEEQLGSVEGAEESEAESAAKLVAAAKTIASLKAALDAEASKATDASKAATAAVEAAKAAEASAVESAKAADKAKAAEAAAAALAKAEAEKAAAAAKAAEEAAAAAEKAAEPSEAVEEAVSEPPEGIDDDDDEV